MRAIEVLQTGATPEIQLTEKRSSRLPGAGEVLVDVKSAVVNYADLLVVTGRYQKMPPLPFVPGKEAAGIVRATGAGVTRISPGDAVIAHVDDGAYATEMIAAEPQCQVLPDDMSFTEACVVGLAAQTAWFALLERGAWRDGECVLINGATGAVGHAAVQIAVAQGASVIAGVSNATRAKELFSGLNCSLVDVGATDLRNALRSQVFETTAGNGVDLVIDTLGGDVFDASVRALAWCGRIVTVGFATGRVPEIKAGHLLVKNASVAGLQWTDYRDREPWKVAQAHAGLVDLWKRELLRAPVMKTFALADFAEAFALLQSRKATGRLIFSME